MDELRDVRKRISKRRGGYGEEKHRPVFFFRFFYHVIMKIEKKKSASYQAPGGFCFYDILLRKEKYE